MEDSLKVSNANRFVVEDSITKVTSDGEPHEIMTLIAGLSGLFAAFIILAILVTLIGCKKRERPQHSSDDSAPPSPGGINDIPDNGSKRSSILPIFTKGSNLGYGASDCPRLISVSVIANNFGANLNSAFVGSELSLNNKMPKYSVDTDVGDKPATTIDMEKF